MPYFGLGSPNASTMRVHADDDSSTAAVAGDVGYNEEKKRSAAAEDDEIPAVAKKKIKGAAGEEDSQSDLIATKQELPVIALNMTKDFTYAKFVESYEESNISAAPQKHYQYHSFCKDMAKGALEELKKSFRPVDSKGHPIDDKAAEKTLHNCFYGLHLTKKKKKIKAAAGKEDSQPGLSLPADSRSVEETPSQKSSRAKSSTRSQPQGERPNDKTPTKLQFTELERLELLRYYGRSIISDYFHHKDVKDCDKKVDDCEWYFKPKKSDTEWVALKKGYNEKDAAEGVNKFTGVLNIAKWANHNGVFERYADTPWGENFLDRKGLCLQSLRRIFDGERVDQNDSQHRTGRAVSPSSSPTASVSETQRVKFDLQGDERREWTRFFNDISQKLSAARNSDDASGKEFYGVLFDYLTKNMVNSQQWNDEKKGILETYMKDYEEAERMKIVGVNDTFINEKMLPSLITEAKEKLCA